RGACTRLDATQPVTQGNLPGGCTLNADTSISFVSRTGFAPAAAVVPPINEYSGLFGIWARPTQNLNIRFDAEFFSADGTFTPISTKEVEEERERAKYNLTNCLNLDGNILIWESRNNQSQQGDLNTIALTP